MFYQIIFLYWLLVISKVQFSSLCRLFAVLHEHRFQEYSKCRAYQTLFSYKAISKNNKYKLNKFFIMLKRNSFKFLCKFSVCQKLEPAGRIGDFGIFWTVSLKVHACFDGPEYWMNAIYLKKLWNTAFCTKSVWQKQGLIVLFLLRRDV